jgi:hypothetical protein
MLQHPGRFPFKEPHTPIAMKIKVTAVKPRNPLVAAALQRKAGAHRRSRSGVRHRSRLALQLELQAEHRSAHDD